jgi:hypothetical protein
VKRCALITALAVTLLAAGCAGTLRTSNMKSTEPIRGTFDLILYGGNHLQDLETTAILDVAGDPYTIVPRAPEFDYRVMKGLDAVEAIERARAFDLHNPAATAVLPMRVQTAQGTVVAYELRPLYQPFAFEDVLRVSYWESGDGIIRVSVHLKPQVEDMLHSGGGFHIFGD